MHREREDDSSGSDPDILDDEEMDMFSAFEGDHAETLKTKRIHRHRPHAANAALAEAARQPSASNPVQLVDNVDDSEGYYRFVPGEKLDDGRYQITINLGKGMFSSVVKANILRARDQERHHDVVGKEVAIKIVRGQESM